MHLWVETGQHLQLCSIPRKLGCMKERCAATWVHTILYIKKNCVLHCSKFVPAPIFIVKTVDSLMHEASGLACCLDVVPSWRRALADMLLPKILHCPSPVINSLLFINIEISPISVHLFLFCATALATCRDPQSVMANVCAGYVYLKNLI